MILWLWIDWMKFVEDTCCLWLNFSKGFVVVSKWCSETVYDLVFILELQWFRFQDSLFQDLYAGMLHGKCVHMRVFYCKVAYIIWHMDDQGLQ